MQKLIRFLATIAFTANMSIAAQANDSIFPPAKVAKSAIDFDGRGFLIYGKRTFLVSGGCEYSRVPRELWKDRLLRAKRAGFNTIELYVFWNYHESRKGQYDFSGNRDLDSYLKLIHSLGMYATVRVGPYICGEWDSGGYPVWLRFEKGLRVREQEPVYEAAVDRWFDHLLPIIARNQIHRGGSVILVQLENEHPSGWGTDTPNDYFRHLQKKALSSGIEVPYFFSGLHHGWDPAGDTPWETSTRNSPWMTTEFWPGWINLYGERDTDSIRFVDRGMWKILAYGGAGYNFYMLHGGTNFDYTTATENGSSYDYGSAIGQSGDFRTLYYRFKRGGWFAQSFASILADSNNATTRYRNAATNGTIRVTARQSRSGTLLFLDNNSKSPVQTQVHQENGSLLPQAGPFTIAPGEIMPVVRDFAVAPGIQLKSAVARILGISKSGTTTTIVTYGVPFDPMEMEFVTSSTAHLLGASRGAWKQSGNRISLTVNIPQASVNDYSFQVGNQYVRVLVTDTNTADKTWFLNADKTNPGLVVLNTGYPLRIQRQKDGYHILVEQKGSVTNTKARVYPMGVGNPMTLLAHASSKTPLKEPVLTDWKQFPAPEPSTTFNTSQWLTASHPLPMGADGDPTWYSWYRTTLTVPSAGEYSLDFRDAGDWLGVFVNGKPAGFSSLRQRMRSPIRSLFRVPLQAGKNALTVLVAQDGRDKLFNYTGEIASFDAKGIVGNVYLTKETLPKDISLTDWETTPATDTSDAVAQSITDSNRLVWKSVKIGDDVFNSKPGYAWYRTDLPSMPPLGSNSQRYLIFDSVDDNATIYLNGKRLLHHEKWNEAFSVNVGTAWKNEKPNHLVVLVDNRDNKGGIMGAVTLQTLTQNIPAVTGWKMRGGPGTPPALASPAWKPIGNKELPRPGTWYQTQFSLSESDILSGRVLRVSLTGMSRGFVWLNGHNLGRYPEKIPVDGVYLPECLLTSKGKNVLRIFDEEGKPVTQVHLTKEVEGTRQLIEYTPIR